MNDPMREKFEAWHNDFYGPQDQYNQIRSLRHFDEEIGLGYVDPVVQAQFCAFKGGQDTIAEQAKMIEHLRGGPTPLFTGVDMADSSADGRRSLAEYLIKQIAIEHPDQDTLLTVKYIAQWIALETGL